MEKEIEKVAQIFAEELQKFRTRSERDLYHADKLTLSVEVSNNKAKVLLEYHKGYGGHVEAASLGILMDEVYRRAGFDDREAGKTQALSDSLIALPAPQEEIEILQPEIPEEFR